MDEFIGQSNQTISLKPKKSKIKIKAVAASMVDQCSWYRGMGPLGEIARRRDDIEIDFVPEVKVFRWDEVVKHDLLFFLRPFTKAHFETLQLAKAMGLSVWVDYDDDFFVPEECSWMAENILTTEWVEKSLALADEVSVSTPSIAESFRGKVKREYTVIPNGMDMRIGSKMIGHTYKERTKTIAWRGSETHDNDLLEISLQYCATLNAAPDWKTWFYWGYPKFISYFIEHVHTRKPTALFLQSLAQNCHNILMHPLNPTQFNHGKSNAAYLEGTMAGSMIIGRNLPEWKNLPNCFTYKSANEFSRVLKDLMSMSEVERMKHIEKGQRHIFLNFNLQKLNAAREAIIERLT